MTITKTDKFSIIDRLENHYIMMPSGNWYLVKDQQVTIGNLAFPMLLYDTGTLTVYLRDSKTEAEYHQWYNDQQLALARAGAYS